MDVLTFLVSLGAILLGCELFTNSVEWAGKRFNLSEGAVGSVLAAVGTALPETVLPLIAILLLGGDAGAEIGTGAILGAPFMLATLALFVCGVSVLAFARRRGTKALHIDQTSTRRDLRYFLLAYSLATVAALVPPGLGWFRASLSLFLIPLYGFYVWSNLRVGPRKGAYDELEALYFQKVVVRLREDEGQTRVDDPVAGKLDLLRRRRPSTTAILLQMVVALAAIILGANLFIDQINSLAGELGVAPVIMSLLIAPIATELPEKFNSFLWIREGKDTYALGNVTGAMVFQSCIPVTVGITLTPWHLDTSNPVDALQVASIGIALLSGILLYAQSGRPRIKAGGLLIGGLLYVVFIAMVPYIL